jgi:hypothetical protein
MSVVQTDLRNTRQRAKEIYYSPAGGLAAVYDVQGAIDALQVEVLTGAVTPPAIVAKTINLILSPYQVVATDYLLEVDTAGGSVTINMMAASDRNNLPITIKDVTGHATANPISVVPDGTETIDSLAPYPINSDFGGYNFKPLAGGYTVIP